MIYIVTYWYRGMNGLIRKEEVGRYDDSNHAFRLANFRAGEKVECHRYSDETMTDPVLVWSFESYAGE